MKRKIWALAITLFVCSFGTYWLYHLASDFYDFMQAYMRETYNLSIGHWELFHLVFAMSITSLPLFAYLAWIIRGAFSWMLLLQYNLFILFSFVLLTAIPVVRLRSQMKRNSLFFEQTWYGSGELYWNYVLLTASLLAGIGFIVYSVIRRNSKKALNEPLDR